MRFLKELKLIKWPSIKTIIKEYWAIIVCSGIFIGISLLANLLISTILQMIM